MCPNGHQNTFGASFCRDCGQPISEAPVVCAQGHANAATDQFCSECGESLSEAPIAARVSDAPAPQSAGSEPGGAAEPVQRADRAKRWLSQRRNQYLAGGVAIALIAAVVLLVTLTGGSSSHTVTGHLILTDADTATSSCVGQGGYDDITQGAALTILDENGTVIGSGSIESGVNTNTDECSYAFSVSGVTDAAKFYHFKISHRDGPSVSHSEMQSNGWTEDLTLGS